MRTAQWLLILAGSLALTGAAPSTALAAPRAKTTKPAAKSTKPSKKKPTAATTAAKSADEAVITHEPIAAEPAKPTPAAAPPADAAPVHESAAKPKAAPASPLRTVGFVGLGAGVAALGAGTVLAIMSSNERSALSGRCPNDVCAESDRASWERGRSQANIATVAFAAGAVLVGTSVALVVFGGPKKEDSQLALRASPNSISLGGTFQ